MLITTKIVFVGNGIFRYNSRTTNKREQFVKNEIKNVSKEDREYLLKLRGKSCRCHNTGEILLFMPYDKWKEERDLLI